MDAEQIEKTGSDAWKSLFEDLGGLPIAQEFWRKSAYNWMTTSSKISRKFEKGSLLSIRFDEQHKDQVHINLGNPHLPIPVLLDYSSQPPLLQAWINLLYKSIEELWFIEDTPAKVPSIPVPVELVAINASDATPLTDKKELTDTLGGRMNNSHPTSLTHGLLLEDKSEYFNVKALVLVGNTTTKNELKGKSMVVGFQSTSTGHKDSIEFAGAEGGPTSRVRRSFLWMFPNKKKGSKVPDRHYFDIQVNETISFEIQMASLIHHFSQTKPSILTFSELLNQTKPSGLTKEFGRIDFRKLFKSMFDINEFLFQPEKYTYVVKPSQIQELQILLSSYKPRDIANVLGWRVLEQFLDHLPNQFRKFKFEFDQTKDHVEEMRNMSMVCSEMIVEYFPAVVGHVIYDDIGSRRTLHFMRKLRRGIRGHLERIVSNNKTVISSAFPIDIEDPEWLVNRNVIDKLYENLNLTSLHFSNHHLSQLVALSEWKTEEHVLRRHIKSPVADKHTNQLINLGKYSILGTSNGFIPSHLLQYPLFDPSMPDSINFGGLGFLMFQQALDELNLKNDTTIGHVNTFIELFTNTSRNLVDIGLGNSPLKENVLPNLEEFSSIQLMLVWLIKTWICASERQDLNQYSEIHYKRQKILREAAPAFKDHFECGSFIFRDRPNFNIGHFLQKDDM